MRCCRNRSRSSIRSWRNTSLDRHRSLIFPGLQARLGRLSLERAAFFQPLRQSQCSSQYWQDREVFIAPRRLFAGNDALERQNAQRNPFEPAKLAAFPLRLKRLESVRLEDSVDLRAVAQLVKSSGANNATLPLHTGEEADVLGFGQAHPEVIIQSHQRRALPDGSHGANENEIYAFLAECFKESAERAVLRLKRHRSCGDMAKNNACCQSSFSSTPRAPLRRR